MRKTNSGIHFFVAFAIYISLQNEMKKTIHASLLAEVNDYLERTGTSPTSLSLSVTFSWETVKRLRSGRNITMHSADALRCVMFEHPNGISGVKEATTIRRKAIEEKRKVKR
jgi:hypothetical protein